MITVKELKRLLDNFDDDTEIFFGDVITQTLNKGVGNIYRFGLCAKIVAENNGYKDVPKGKEYLMISPNFAGYTEKFKWSQDTVSFFLGDGADWETDWSFQKRSKL